MTLQQLRYIEALDKYRHFGKAAEACLVTQPTLTMQLKKLEDEMGVLLFDRSKQPIKPTPSGSIVLAKAKEILQQTDQLFNYVRGEHTNLAGTYQIGVIPTVAPYLLPRFLPSFISKYPESTLVIREMQTERIIEGLMEGSLDMGLLVTPLHESALREVPLFNEPFFVYTHDAKMADNVAHDELSEQGLMLLEEGHCFRAQTLEICGNREQQGLLNLDFRSGSIESLKGLVRKGLGYTLVPALSVTEDDTALIRRFAAPAPVREISIVTHKSFVRERFLEVLREHIRSSIPEEYLNESTFYQVRWRQV